MSVKDLDSLTPMETAQKTDNRGGFRPGSGRKAASSGGISRAQISRMEKKRRKREKQQGRDFDDVLLDLIYGSGTKPAERLAAMKLWKEQTTPSKDSGDDEKPKGPIFFLPEQRPPELEALHPKPEPAQQAA